MPTFRVYYTYTAISGDVVTGSHVTQMNSPEDARRATVSKFKPLTKDGYIDIKKIKRVRV